MIRHRTKSLPAARRLGLAVVALSTAWLAVGCAKLPVVAREPQLRNPDSFQSAESFQAIAAAWPTDQWWTTYGDPQLDRLVDEALRNAPDMAAATARLEMADAMVQLSGSTRKPQVSVNASASEDRLSYNYLTPPYMTPTGWNDYGRITLDARWELDFWGKNRAGLAAATSEREALRAEWGQARLMLASGIAIHYAELSRLYANRDLGKKAVEIRQKTANLFAQRFANGLETRGSMREADARRAMAEGNLLALEEQIALQCNRLATLVGAGPDRGLTITVPTLKGGHGFGLPEELGVNLIGRRPDIVAARWQAEAQARRVEERKAAFYPNINLSAFIGFQSLGLDMLTKDGSRVGNIGPAISLPIFSAGRLRGQLRGAHAQYAEAIARYNDTLARALQEVADNAVSQKAMTQRLLKAQEAVDAATESHRVASNRYEGGLANFLEVLSAEDSLLNSLNAQTNLCFRSLMLDIGLKRALGGGYRMAK